MDIRAPIGSILLSTNLLFHQKFLLCWNKSAETEEQPCPCRLRRERGMRTAGERAGISKAKHGDQAAFSCLYERHKRRVFSLCYRIVRNPAQADELMKDTF